MLRLRRIERVSHVVHGDTPVALVEVNWFFQAGRNDRSGGFSYRSPVKVAVEGQPTIRIHDHVMLARLGVALLTMILMLTVRTVRKN